MIGKILIAIHDEFLSRIYFDFFREEGFLVSVAKDGSEILSLILKNIPDVILLDIFFAEKNNFKILNELKDNSSTRKIPIVLLSHSEDDKYRKKAVEFEVKDFLVGEYSSPIIIFNRIMTHLKGEKSYQIPLEIKNPKIKELASDLEYKSLICDKCSSNMELNLIRDTSKGKNYFKISFICPVCGI